MREQERHYTATAMVGGLMLECFFSSSSFLSTSDGANSVFTEEHAHANYELLICRGGHGFQFVNNCAHTYGNASVFLFAPFTRHAHISNDIQAERRCSFRFQPAKDQPNEKSARGSAVLEQLEEQGYAALTASPLLLYALDELTRMLAVQNRAGPLVDGITALILSDVFQTLEDMAGRRKKMQHEDWSSIGDLNYRRFLIDHFFDQLVNRNARMEDLCQQVHLSPNQLNRVIREIFGMTFKQKLTEVRIAYIKYFLKYSNLTINEIAQKTNFLENSNFSLFFKQHCGETPSQYRAREQCISLE